MKTCKTCSSTTFYASGKCKACLLAWRTANPDRVKAARTKYAKANRVELNERAKEDYHADPTKRALAASKWRRSNREKYQSTARKWSAENVQRHAQMRLEWAANNPEARRTYTANYRARKRNNGGKLTRGLAKRLYKLQLGKCACCRLPLGEDFHRDHVMPLALGGANEDWNMQLLCATCNFSKGDKHPVEFMQSRGFLL